MTNNVETNEPAERIPEIMDVTKICSTFPFPVGIQIPRDNIHHTLETVFEGDASLIVVEGAEGIGKTTLLAQFAERKSNRCLCMFVKVVSRLAHDPALLRADLCNQINWIISQGEIPAATPGNQSVYRRLITELQRRARRPGDRFYFILDGLDELPQNDENIQGILDLLPLGLPQFRFLVSGSSREMSKLIRQKLVCKSVEVTGFTVDETARFFSDVSISPELVNEFYKACKGVPSRLAAFKRIILSGISPEALSGQLPDSLADSFRIEWKAVSTSNEVQLGALALLAYDKRRLSSSQIAEILEVDEGEVKTALQSLTFLEQATEYDGGLGFVSESFRKFAQIQLRDKKEESRSQAIKSLLKNPISKDALTHLPGFLEESGKFIELLNFLSPEHLVAMIKSSQDLGLAQQKAKLGVKAALNLSKDDHLYRFGLQEAIIAELDGCDISRSEVEARMALSEYESALALAQTTVLKQDRLRLLALIARLQKENGLTPEAAVLEQIDQLYQETDASALGDNLAGC